MGPVIYRRMFHDTVHLCPVQAGLIKQVAERMHVPLVGGHAPKCELLILSSRL